MAAAPEAALEPEAAAPVATGVEAPLLVGTLSDAEEETAALLLCTCRITIKLVD